MKNISKAKSPKRSEAARKTDPVTIGIDLGDSQNYQKTIYAENVKAPMLNCRGPFDPESFSLDRINAELRKEFTPRAKRSRGKKPTAH